MGADPCFYSKPREDKHCLYSESKQYLSYESKSANSSSKRALTSHAFKPECEAEWWTPRAPEASCCKDAINEYSGTVNGACGTGWQLARWAADVKPCETGRALLPPVAWRTAISTRLSDEFVISCGKVLDCRRGSGRLWELQRTLAPVELPWVRGEERFSLTISERKSLNITLLSLSSLVSQSLPLCSAKFSCRRPRSARWG